MAAAEGSCAFLATSEQSPPNFGSQSAKNAGPVCASAPARGNAGLQLHTSNKCPTSNNDF